MIDKKKCKGNGVASGYGCGEMVPVSLYGQSNRVYGLGKSCRCYSDWLINSKDGKLKMEKATLKATKPRKELEKAEKERNNRKGLTTLIKSVVNVFHEYVRERDKGKPCIACGTQWKSDFQASHYYKAELYSTIKLHEDNVHGGCVECNLRKEGNLSEYQLNLPKRIGEDLFEALNHLASVDKKANHKWDRETLIQTRNYYRKKLKELKKQTA